MTGVRVRGALVGAGFFAAAAAACVRIDTAGPNGIASARVDSVPPSIVIGDSLRDADGKVTVLSAKAFDAAGSEIATVPLRFVYVPSARDSLNRLILDSALTVDSLTGAVTARSAFTLSQGLVAVRVGDGLQLIDTLAIVPAPDSALTDTAVTAPLRYNCADTSQALSARLFGVTDSAFATSYNFNAIGPFRVVVRGDSAGTRVPIRRRLVRWVVESGVPTSIPQVPLPGSTTTVPVIGVAFNTVDRILSADTTDASGRSTVRLRIRPYALGPSVIAADTFTVRLKAIAQPGPKAIATDSMTFRVRLERDKTVACR